MFCQQKVQEKYAGNIPHEPLKVTNILMCIKSDPMKSMHDCNSPKVSGKFCPVDEEREGVKVPRVELIVEGPCKTDPNEVAGEQHVQNLCKRDKGREKERERASEERERERKRREREHH